MADVSLRSQAWKQIGILSILGSDSALQNELQKKKKTIRRSHCLSVSLLCVLLHYREPWLWEEGLTNTVNMHHG